LKGWDEGNDKAIILTNFAKRIGLVKCCVLTVLYLAKILIQDRDEATMNGRNQKDNGDS